MKILILTSRFPFPIEKGDKLRIYYQIRELSQQHELVLCALSDQPVSAEARAHISQFCDAIYTFRLRKLSIGMHAFFALFGREPVQVAYFYRKRIQRAIQEIIRKEAPDHIYCQLLRMAPYCQEISVPITLDYMDCFSIGMERRAQKAGSLFRSFLKQEAQRLADFETQIYSRFRHHTIISKQDRDLLPFPEKRLVAIVPNGVDTDFFTPNPQTNPTHTIIFVGNMGYFPNVQAAKFLVREVMPIVWKSEPEVTVLLAGARPSTEVQALTGDRRVDVSGWMDDIREAYAAGSMFVAPLFTGSGQQNKILEAMAMELPCITTPMVNNAIGARVNHTILEADSPDSFATQILSLHADSSLQKQMGKAAREMVKKAFSWSSAVEKLQMMWDQK